ncbi:hypothetical protein NW762_013211 [Fusarium torreyae]|uniref:Uncharacterized protein n=1 Tax=Fusarium torreyae TaxID=1237075 RepID=A0A9W8RMR6_9HYPO|nr:hypothetical protein NW762_013211 [Fusarium torreyae]
MCKMLLDGENEWKMRMEDQVHDLQTALAEVKKVSYLPQYDHSEFSSARGSDRDPVTALPPEEMLQTPDGGFSVIKPGDVTTMTRQNSLNLACRRKKQTTFHTPMSSLYEATQHPK